MKTAKKTTRLRTRASTTPATPATVKTGPDGIPARLVRDVRDLPTEFYSEEVHHWIEGKRNLPADVRRATELHLSLRRTSVLDASEPKNPRTRALIRIIEKFKKVSAEADAAGVRWLVLPYVTGAVLSRNETILKRLKERPRKQRAASQFGYHSLKFWTAWFAEHVPMNVAEAYAREAVKLEVGNVLYGTTKAEQAVAVAKAGSPGRRPKSLVPARRTVERLVAYFKSEGLEDRIAYARGNRRAAEGLAEEFCQDGWFKAEHMDTVVSHLIRRPTLHSLAALIVALEGTYAHRTARRK